MVITSYKNLSTCNVKRKSVHLNAMRKLSFRIFYVKTTLFWNKGIRHVKVRRSICKHLRNCYYSLWDKIFWTNPETMRTKCLLTFIKLFFYFVADFQCSSASCYFGLLKSPWVYYTLLQRIKHGDPFKTFTSAGKQIAC